MVKFLNQKEDVISIELTPYGKEKFASGSFNPRYYAFYDTDILYDAEYAGVSESQNNIVTRIKNRTARLAPFVWQSSSAAPVQSAHSVNSRNDFYQTNDYNSQFLRFLGTSSPWADYAPSWNIKVTNPSDVVFKNSLEFTASHVIPVMSASMLIKYNTEPFEEGSEQLMYMLEKNETLTLDVQELNTLFKVNGNFDVEVLRVDDSGRLHALGFIDFDNPNSQQLSYQTDPTYLATTLEGTEQEIVTGFPILDNTYVEYYLDIQLDQEIQGVQMPTNSTIYKRNLDRNPGDLCDLEQNNRGAPMDWEDGLV